MFGAEEKKDFCDQVGQFEFQERITVSGSLLIWPLSSSLFSSSPDGFMESPVDDSRTDPLRHMPSFFQDAQIDTLAILIGTAQIFCFLFPIWSLGTELGRVFKADMLERLMLHNDRIPLLP